MNATRHYVLVPTNPKGAPRRGTTTSKPSRVTCPDCLASLVDERLAAR